MDLTEKQKEVLETIKTYIQTFGYSPSIRELCEIVGLSSPATMFYHLKRLKSKGYIDYIPKRMRTIRVLK